MKRWTCAKCGQSVSSGAGWIVVGDDEGGHAIDVDERDRKPWPAAADVGDLIRSMKEYTRHAVALSVYHRACDPRPNGSEYWIQVERAATLTAWCRWVHHLCDKRWMDKHDIATAIAFWFTNRGENINDAP